MSMNSLRKRVLILLKTTNFLPLRRFYFSYIVRDFRISPFRLFLYLKKLRFLGHKNLENFCVRENKKQRGNIADQQSFSVALCCSANSKLRPKIGRASCRERV